MKSRTKVIIILVLLSLFFAYNCQGLLAQDDVDIKERQGQEYKGKHKGEDKGKEPGQHRGKWKHLPPPDGDSDEASPYKPQRAKEADDEEEESFLVLSGPVIATPIEVED